MPCGDFERLLNEYLDARGILSPAPGSQAAIESHVAECPTCRARYARYVVLGQAIRALGPTPALAPGFTGRVLEELAQEPSPPRTFLFPPRRIVVFATAAVVLLAAGLVSRFSGSPARGPKVAPRRCATSGGRHERPLQGPGRRHVGDLEAGERDLGPRGPIRPGNPGNDRTARLVRLGLACRGPSGRCRGGSGFECIR